MSLDKLDIKIQEAAKQYHPVFDEQAWDKMEKLLDDHLPQKKNDKKKFTWPFLLLFLLTISLIVIMKSWNSERKALRYPKENMSSILANVINLGTIKPVNPAQHFTEKKSPKTISVVKNTTSSIGPFSNKKLFTDYSGHNKTIRNFNLSSDIIVELPGTTDEQVKKNNIVLQQPIISKEIIPAIKEDEKIENTNVIAKQNNISDSKIKNSFPKKKSFFRNLFVFNFSAGPDVSAMDIGNIGKLNSIFGGGFGYIINKRWTLRTGFYITREVYNASPSQYNPPSGFWSLYPNLNYINADCKIYEVPFTINYNFAQTSIHRWFAAIGSSSYFMKKEEYDYFSKNFTGQYLYDSYTVNNKNNHYFASLRLSGGYERNINRAFSIIAEPYLNLPLTGIGYGKVKLYSAGILFTLSVKPFVKK